MKKQNNKTKYHKNENYIDYALKQAKVCARESRIATIILIALSFPVLAIVFPLKVIVSLCKLIQKSVEFLCEVIVSFCSGLSISLSGLLLFYDYVDMANENREQKATMDKVLSENKKLKSQLDKAIHNEQNKQR